MPSKAQIVNSKPFSVVKNYGASDVEAAFLTTQYPSSPALHERNDRHVRH